jgi:small subunit ribosomal protein S15
MARMYSRNKGKAGSKKPQESQSSWIRYKPKEVELLIVKFAKSGLWPSQIGLQLRDTYGIPDVKKLTDKTITQILIEKKLAKQTPEDLAALIRRSIVLRKHLGINKKDMGAKRGLQLTESKIRRMAKYYINSNKLPQDWKYDPKRAELAME